MKKSETSFLSSSKSNLPDFQTENHLYQLSMFFSIIRILCPILTLLLGKNQKLVFLVRAKATYPIFRPKIICTSSQCFSVSLEFCVPTRRCSYEKIRN